MVLHLIQLCVSLLPPDVIAVQIIWATELLLTMSYVVTTFLRTSGSVPWGSKVGYWSLRLNTRRGLLSGPVSRGERAKMHCFRLATAERPHSSLKDTMAFCRERREISSWDCTRFILECQVKHLSNVIIISKHLKMKLNTPCCKNVEWICIKNITTTSQSCPQLKKSGQELICYLWKLSLGHLLATNKYSILFVQTPVSHENGTNTHTPPYTYTQILTFLWEAKFKPYINNRRDKLWHHGQDVLQSQGQCLVITQWLQYKQGHQNKS